jgi:hypothetical protein
LEAAIKPNGIASAAIAMLFAVHAHAAVQTVDAWSISQTPSGSVLSLAGIWPSGCTPDTAELTATSGLITILVPPPILPPGTGCAAALTRWSLLVPLGGLADGSYVVRVTSYGAPEPPTSPAILVQFPIFVSAGVASLVQPVPVAGSLAYFLVSLMLLGIGRLSLHARPISSSTGRE